MIQVFFLVKVTLSMMNHNQCLFQPMLSGLTYTIVAWESKGLWNEKMKPPTTSNNSLSPNLKQHNSKIRVKYKGSYLKQSKVTFTPNNIVNLFAAYELDRWSQNLNADFTLKDCLFGAVKLTKNADLDKNSYSRDCIGFNSCSLFSDLGFHSGKNVWSRQQFINAY